MADQEMYLLAFGVLAAINFLAGLVNAVFDRPFISTLNIFLAFALTAQVFKLAAL